MAKLFRFAKSESGAVTADWVLVTAGAMVLALGATAMVFQGAEAKSTTLSTLIAERPVGN